MKLFTYLLMCSKKTIKNILAFISKAIPQKPIENFIRSGCVASDGEYYGFQSLNKYLSLPIVAPQNSMDLIVKTKTPTSFNGYEGYTTLFYGAREQCSGIVWSIDNNGNSRLWLSSNGVSWDICQNHNPHLSVPKNSDVWFRIIWDGVQYYFGISTDGETYNYAMPLDNNLPIYVNSAYHNIGGCNWERYYWTGGIVNIKQTKFTVDGNIVFDGSTAIEGIDFINNGMLPRVPEKCIGNFHRYNYMEVPIDTGNMTSFEWVLKTKTSPNFNIHNRLWHYSGNYYGLLYQVCAGDGNLIIWLSDSNSSWSIKDAWNTGLSLPKNTDVWCLFKWDGSTYTVGYSTDGNTYVTASFNDTRKPLFRDGKQAIGGYHIEDTWWEGLLYCEGSYLKINNLVVWKPMLYPLKVGDSIKINEGVGLSKHKWSATTPEININEFSLNSKIEAITVDDENNRVYEIKKPIVPTKNIQVRSGDYYDCYSNGQNDIYLKKTKNIITENDFRYTLEDSINGPFYWWFDNNRYIDLGILPDYDTLEVIMEYKNFHYNPLTVVSDFFNIGNNGITLGTNENKLFLDTPDGSLVESFTCKMDSFDKIKVKLTYDGSKYDLYFEDVAKKWRLCKSKTQCSKIFGRINIGKSRDESNNSRFCHGGVDISKVKIKYMKSGIENVFFDGSTAIVGTHYTVNGNLQQAIDDTHFIGHFGKVKVLGNPKINEAQSWEMKLDLRSRSGAIYIYGYNDYKSIKLERINPNNARFYMSSNGLSWDITGDAFFYDDTQERNYVKIGCEPDPNNEGKYRYYSWLSNIGWDDINAQKRIFITNAKKAQWTEGFYFLISSFNDIVTEGFPEVFMTIDGVNYKFGQATLLNKIYELNQNNQLVEKSGIVKINQDNTITLDGQIYTFNPTKHYLISAEDESVIVESSDGNFDIRIRTNISDAQIMSSAALTEKYRYIKNSIYRKFDIEYLEGYNTKVIVSNRIYEPYKFPLYFTKDMQIVLIMQRTANPNEIYQNILWLDQDLIQKKHKLIVNIDQIADNIEVYVNDTCKWDFSNTNKFEIEAYTGDVIKYKISKAGYANYEKKYVVQNAHQIPINTLNISMIKVHRYTFNVNQSDCKYEFDSFGLYDCKDNWVELYDDTMLRYKISKDNFENLVGEFKNIQSDNTVNLNMKPITSQNITCVLDKRNIYNKGCILSVNSDDHIIASGELNTHNLLNYNYLTLPPLPLDKAKSWELQTTYRYLGGGPSPMIFCSSDQNWESGGIVLNTDSGRFKISQSINSAYGHVNNADTNVISERGYSYKFKIGQILEDNGWTPNDGGGEKSLFYVDYVKSDRDSTENPKLISNAILGGPEYACSSSEVNENTWKLFNPIVSDGVNLPFTDNGTFNGVSYGLQASHKNEHAFWAFDGDTTTVDKYWNTSHGRTTPDNPCWITFYSPKPFKPTAVFILNTNVGYNDIKSAYIQGSNNNNDWTTLYHIIDRPNKKEYSEKYNLNSENTYKYIRIYIFDGYSTSGISVKEIKIYGLPKGFEATQVPSDLNPIWLTYYTPKAIRPSAFIIKNDDSLNNMKNGIIEGSQDNISWDTLYNILNKPQGKNTITKYYPTTQNKYKYFRLKITERYATYKDSVKNHHIVNNSQLNVTIRDDFYRNTSLFGDSEGAIGDFQLSLDGWKLNGNIVNLKNYFMYTPKFQQTTDIVELPQNIYMGFNNQNYLTLMPSSFVLNQTDEWEILIKCKMNNISRVNTVIAFTLNKDTKGFLGRLDNGKFNFIASTDGSWWNINTNPIGATHQANIWYYFKWKFDGNSYYVESSTDGINFTQQIKVDNTNPIYTDYHPIIIGNRNFDNHEFFDGQIDLKESYIKINNNKVFDGLNLINLQEGENIKIYYSTKVTEFPVTSTNIKEFIIDGFPFTYSNNYRRIYTYRRNEKEFNIVHNKLIRNPSYVDQKRPYIKDPLCMLGSKINQSSWYAKGSIDLDETKCYIDGQLYWEATYTPKVGDKVYVNRGYGLDNNNFTINNLHSEKNGDLSIPAIVTAINGDQITAQYTYYPHNEITINANPEGSEILTLNELPTAEIDININSEADSNEPKIYIDTKPLDKRVTFINGGKQKFYIEVLKEFTIELFINNRKVILNSDNPIFDDYIEIKNWIDNSSNFFYYIIKNGTNIIGEKQWELVKDKPIKMLTHTFKAICNPTLTGYVVSYSFDNKNFITIEEISCYSGQTIYYKAEKAGSQTYQGSFTIPQDDSSNKTYNVVI